MATQIVLASRIHGVHNPQIIPQTYPIDANFDNYWCWDDGFPTCDPCEYRGEHYQGLGELRSLK